ncbi:MAG: DinB family protein [Acidobacteriia bacterium]|nr:DinB family protein [Terriglobia bacterium]
MKRSDPAIALLLAALEEAFQSRSWHGTNLRGSLRGVTAKESVWRPGPGRHNIGELAVHAAYWKYVVRRTITGAKRGSFPLKGSNWFPREAVDAAGWRRDQRLLAEEHRRLRDAVAAFPTAQLGTLSAKKKYTYAALIRGIAAHDLYHAGQIQLLKRLRAR